MKTNVTRPHKGINKDTSPQDQPKDTYRFGLNAIIESEMGDIGFIGNEESNEPCGSLPNGYVPLGKEYIGNGQTAILSVNPELGLSEIGILDDCCNYETHVNFDLNFNISKQIDITYRLRRGCERVIYFTDDYNQPRYYNFDKPEDFQDGAGNWDTEEFNLFKTYNQIPLFDNIKLLESGALLPGSYNFSIQYLDEDLNPTEWITTSDTIIVYNDSTTALTFPEVRGSSNKESNYRVFGVTNKAIKLTFSNLDNSYPFYRIAIIEANNGSGAVNRVVYSSEISTSINTFTYTGDNAFTEGTIEEVQQFSNRITRAKHIEQIENRLILSNTTGKQINWCKLQKYASKIRADLVTEEIVLNDLSIINNQKRGQLHIEKLGYMPGEIYSFGIVYVFEDGTVSPAYHIPGRNETYFSQMDEDNKLSDTFYTDNNNCGAEDYWGVDSQGEGLVGTQVRHHRFPLRCDLNLPLYRTEGENSEITTTGLYLNITGEILPSFTGETITYVVNYEVGGNPFQSTFTINIDNYDDSVGLLGQFVDSSVENIVLVSIQEIDDTNTPVDPSVNSGLNYNSYLETNSTVSDDKVYKTDILGIKFSNVQIPSELDTGDCKVVGYYIVRNERTEDEKTILDNGVITPLIAEDRDTVSKFVAHGHLVPNTDKIQEDLVAIIHPEHKFRNKEYSNTTQYIQQGFYLVHDIKTSDEIVQDVQPGTSYDPKVNKRRERDSDGFDLHIMTRHNEVQYVRSCQDFANQDDIKETFYLNSLFSKGVTDINGERKDVYNLSSDNKIGIIHLNQSLDTDELKQRLPYVVMKRDLGSSYSGFRVLPYYRETTNPVFFVGDTLSEISIFNGDSYVSPMKYTSSMYYNIRLRDRANKKGVWNFIIGILSTIGGAVATAFGLAPLGVSLIGFGVSQIASGVTKLQTAKVYQDLYEQGLRDTIDDDDTQAVFGPNPPDDELQYFFDILSNLWVESSVNMNWRMGNTIGLTDFMNSPTGYDEVQLNTYAIEKVTTVDSSADGGRNYLGYCMAELYEVNEDYRRRNKEKLHYHLGLEYDCCSDCAEDFPHRNHYSEQSFQEELSDNYRIFLPNNYRDIEGETGEITNTFRIQNNFYIHTQEALWHLPQNIQERVTGEIISFVGTGDFFGIPPRKIVDSDYGNSAGTQHKWGTIKTPHGVFFPCERQNTFFKFDGNGLNPISNQGLFSWCKNNMTVGKDKDYYQQTGREFPYRDNPSNPFGSGYIAVYDSRKERIIFTKRDGAFGGEVTGNGDFEICGENGELVVFPNFNQTIADQEALGWEFVGIENCQLNFQRVTSETQQVEIVSSIPNETDIHVFLDTSGSFGAAEDTCLQSIQDAVDDWLVNFASANPDWTGNLYVYEDSTERWVNYAQQIVNTTYNGQTLSDKDVIVISFCNEAQPTYHGSTLSTSIQNPTANYTTDYNNFVALQAQFNSFIGIAYPIVFGQNSGSCSGTGGGNLNSSKEFLLHSIAALYGDDLTASDISSELPIANPGFTTAEWNDLLGALAGTNPYPSPGLKDFGWVGKWDRSAASDGSVINDAEFNADIQDLLQAFITTEIVDVEVPVLEYQTIDGVIVEDTEAIDKSWTLSYSLKLNSWTSWHSYLPNFYINTPDKFYSWITGRREFWKHNRIGHYQTFYERYYPFVVDYVAISEPLATKLWDYLVFQTEAKIYDGTNKCYYDERFRTFNKAIFYNTRQCSGLLNLKVKDLEQLDENYLVNQVNDYIADTITIDRNERNWSLNELRDIRVDYKTPIFNKNCELFQDRYFIDKVLNLSSLDFEKDWTQLESFRDKYLRVRLIFDNFDDTKLLFNYSVETERQSFR